MASPNTLALRANAPKVQPRLIGDFTPIEREIVVKNKKQKITQNTKQRAGKPIASRDGTIYVTSVTGTLVGQKPKSRRDLWRNERGGY